ncbi:MAG: hypothetical protein QXI16_03180 [Sulfolobaceae archaeon]
MTIILIILAIILIALFKMELNASFIANTFKHSNVLVFGKKRKGKDLLFQKVIKKRKKEEYFSIIPYGYKYNEIKIKDISVYPNTFEDFIEGNIIKIDRDEKREKRDIYISDGGAWLPSQYNHILNKLYPSAPLYYGLSGHLYDSNVHVNYNGSFNRIWDKLREQADDYFKVLNTIKIGKIFFTKVRYFEEYQAAERNVLPLKRSLFPAGSYHTAQKVFNAENGLVKDMWICQVNPKYDTRYFKKVFFKD